jgi:hypothetical protein
MGTPASVGQRKHHERRTPQAAASCMHLFYRDLLRLARQWSRGSASGLILREIWMLLT